MFRIGTYVDVEDTLNNDKYKGCILNIEFFDESLLLINRSKRIRIANRIYKVLLYAKMGDPIEEIDEVIYVDGLNQWQMSIRL